MRTISKDDCKKVEVGSGWFSDPLYVVTGIDLSIVLPSSWGALGAPADDQTDRSGWSSFGNLTLLCAGLVFTVVSGQFIEFTVRNFLRGSTGS